MYKLALKKASKLSGRRNFIKPGNSLFEKFLINYFIPLALILAFVF